jgi:hypothetical protein
VPMTDTAVAVPVGYTAGAIASTLPEFGAFVVLPVNSPARTASAQRSGLTPVPGSPLPACRFGAVQTVVSLGGIAGALALFQWRLRHRARNG